MPIPDAPDLPAVGRRITALANEQRARHSALRDAAAKCRGLQAAYEESWQGGEKGHILDRAGACRECAEAIETMIVQLTPPGEPHARPRKDRR